jgi:NifB/MoaA-like Fe-S oxidoreductase
MLRHGENVFLDDYTVPRLEAELGCRVQVVGPDGGDLADAMLAESLSR